MNQSIPTDSAASSGHAGVMVEEVVALLAPLGEGLVLDATFGRGGHSRALLQRTRCRVLAIDCDPEAVAYGQSAADSVLEAARKVQRFSVVHGFFGALDRLPQQRFDGVLFDLGASSPQLDCPERGFSFRNDGPLDMRMARQGKTAAEWINGVSEQTLVQVFRECGEKRARAAARAIATARPMSRTRELTRLLHSVLPKARNSRIDSATRCFLAIRIAVNEEQQQLRQGLTQGIDMLECKGRMVAISFHGLEDRIVKRHFATQTHKAARVSRYRPSREDIVPSTAFVPRCRPLPPSILYPRAEEIAGNPRARSARLRALEKVC